MRSRRPSVLASVTVAVVAIAGLGGCGGDPSTKRVTEDVIESLQDLDDTTRDCMLEVVDAYSEDELENMGVENADFRSLDDLDGASPELQEFVERLQACQSGDG